MSPYNSGGSAQLCTRQCSGVESQAANLVSNANQTRTPCDMTYCKDSYLCNATQTFLDIRKVDCGTKTKEGDGASETHSSTLALSSDTISLRNYALPSRSTRSECCSSGRHLDPPKNASVDCYVLTDVGEERDSEVARQDVEERELYCEGESCCRTSECIQKPTTEAELSADADVKALSSQRGAVDKKECCLVKNVNVSGRDRNCNLSVSSEELELLDGDEDKETMCDCCVIAALTNVENHAVPEDQNRGFWTRLQPVEERLRRCCRVFRRCALRDCCFVPQLKTSAPKQSSVKRAGLNDTFSRQASIPAMKLDDAEVTEMRTTLLLSVGGMDCPDCASNITRALKQLPSVTPTNLDYFAGTAELTFDPDIMQPDAIVRYVARATGFNIETKTLPSHAGDDHISLPYVFSSRVPEQVLERYTVVKRKKPAHSYDVLIPTRGRGARLPRDIDDEISKFGGRLVAASEMKEKDTTARDAHRVTVRCLVSILLCIPTLVFAWASLPGSRIRWRAGALALTTLIYVNAWPLMSSCLRTLVYLRRADLLLLVTISINVAYAFSVISFGLEAAGVHASEPFFETVALLITLIYCGRTVQAVTRRSVASSANALKRIQSSFVIMSKDDGQDEIQLDARLIHYGDELIVRPGMLFPTDAVVIKGSGGVDESTFTGESVPVIKTEGSPVIAGTKNLDGQMLVQVTHLISENSLSRMRQTMFQAQSVRYPFQDLADRLAAMILPAAATSAALAFLIWPFVERYARGSSPSTSGIAGLEYAIAIIVVSCPCALGLAIPLVSSIGIKIGLSEGVLFRSGEALHKSRGITLFAFDKTGTLSHGMFSVQREKLHWHGANQIAAALTRNNEHPIAKSVADATQNSKLINLENVINVPGKGIEASFQGFPVRGGSASFCGFSDDEFIRAYVKAGLSVFAVTLGNRLIASYGLLDAPRKEASILISDLKSQGSKVVLISGDNEGAVKGFAGLLNIPAEDVWSGCSPESKANVVEKFRGEGHKVCYVGDGVNDSIAFASSDVSFSLVSGSDIAVASADVLLMGSNLHHNISKVISLANLTFRHSILSLSWCALYALAAIVLASGILVRFRIEPRWAGLGEVVSVVPVILIGLLMFVFWKRRSFL